MISNPSTSVINELFGKSRDAAASVAASGQTSATPGTATTHALAPSVKAVLVVNAGTAAIAASVDDGTNWVAIAASGSLLVDVPLGRVQVKCDTAARVPYSISATTRAISQTVVPAAVAALDALEAANTIYVGPGLKYESTSAAVTYALAQGAGDTAQWLVLYTPGAVIDHDITPGVIVVPMMIAERELSADGFVNVPSDMALETYVANWQKLRICIVADDGLKNWTTDSAGALTIGGTSVSAQQYAKLKGVIINHAIIPAYVEAGTTGTNEVMTKAQIKTTYLSHGGELLAHTYTHSVQPTTQALMIQESLKAREYINALESDGAIGAVCRGWVQSGDWLEANSIGWNRAVNGNVNGWRGLMVRRYFECSRAYYGNASRTRRHFGTPTASYRSVIKGAFLALFAAPTTDLMITMHGIGADADYGGLAMDYATFKSMVDAIAALQEAGTAVSTSFSGFFAAQDEPLRYYNKVATVDPLTFTRTVCEEYDPYADSVVNGDFEASTGTTVPGWLDMTAAKQVVAGEGVGGSNALKFNDVAAWQSVRGASDAITVLPGRINMLSFDCKVTGLAGGAGAFARVQVTLAHRLPDGSTMSVNLSYTAEGFVRVQGNDTWVTVRLPFGVPKHCTGKTNITIANGEAGTYWFDNFRVEPR